MATSLASQLAQIAANSKASLNVKAQKAAHAKSLIWEPQIATAQNYQTLYNTCYSGFEELCQLDVRFLRFQSTIFSQDSQNEDRTQLTAAENEELDRQIEAFLRLAGSRLRLMPAIKSIEWLIRRFRIHEENTSVLLMAFLPYHSIPVFITLLSILPSRIPSEFRFLSPYIRSLTAPPRSVLVHEAVHHPQFLSSVSEYTLESCRRQYHYPALITFWAGLMTEAMNGILDRTRSGRAAVQSDNIQALLHRFGPIFAETLLMKKIPSLQIASYMALSIFVSKASLHDVALTAFMQQMVNGWTADTVKPGLICLAIMAQFRSAKQMNGKITKALMKIANVGPLLVEIGRERQVDKLANGFCLALVERFTKKGDPRGLPTIMSLLRGQILSDKQTAVIFKSLLLAALQLNDGNDENGTLRRELGAALIALSQTSGPASDVIQSVIQEVDFDIEELEIKLDVSIRKQPEGGDDESHPPPLATAPQNTQSLESEMDELSSRDGSLSSCLLPQPDDMFHDFSRLFFALVSDQSNNAAALAKFDQNPKLLRQTAFKDCTYCSFFIRIWCGPYPALARSAALDMVKNRLKEGDGGRVDLQFLIPYCVVALSDPSSKRVRRAAADLVAVLIGFYTPPIAPKSLKIWGAGKLFGKAKVEMLVTLGADAVARLLHLQLLPSLEECVLDPNHISSIIKAAIEHGKYPVLPPSTLDKKDHMSQSARLALLTFFASHTISTPLASVKVRLLKSLNQVRGVGSTTRTQVLLPVLKWWIDLPDSEVAEILHSEPLDQLELNSRFVDVVTANDSAGVEYLLEILRDSNKGDKTDLMRSIFGRLRNMWTTLKDDEKFTVAKNLLEIFQEASSDGDSASVVPGEAADFLRTVPLTTRILSFFLDTIQTGTKMLTEPPPNKRRRTSSSDGNRGFVASVNPELSLALRKVTFVLQIVENSNPVSHPELLDGLFAVLSELQHFRTVIGSELGYLQNLILRSLLAMMPAYRENKSLEIDSSGGYGDLLVNCIQKSSSPTVQNSALLLVANLATIAPNLVLHSVMPIFTFMGTSVLRQNDDYSAHVVSQTIKEVIPPLIQSLRRGKTSPVAGASEVLVSFTTAYEHIPVHRRRGLFTSLVETLGARDFLFALISMLVDRYDASDSLLRFIGDLLNNFDAETQLETFNKLLDLVFDLFKPKPILSFTLLGFSDDGEVKDTEKIALRQLTALPALLSSKKLESEFGRLAGCSDEEGSEVRSLYATLLAKILSMADAVRSNKLLRGRCGAALSKLLNLLSIGDFIKAVESLLEKPDMILRQKVLGALEARVEAEHNTDAQSRKALLDFLPRLTAAIKDSDDIRYKHTAVACVDKIAEKYGKKGVDAVVAAAETIAGDNCLGHDEKRLRIMALLCLTSLVDVLQEAIVPVLPVALPRTVAYLEASSRGELRDEELQSACYGFISSLAEHLPYMLSKQVDPILIASTVSAEAGLKDETKESRMTCLVLLAKQLDAREMFTSLDRTWEKAESAGFSALSEYLDVLGTAIDKHSKSVVMKNAATLSSIFLKAMDLRRRVQAAGEWDGATSGAVLGIEAKVNERALKMIYKLNDATFRPIFAQMLEWAGRGLAKSNASGRVLRKTSLYGFLQLFFGQLKSIVTNYATYMVEDAAENLRTANFKVAEERELWRRTLTTLAACFEHDQDGFWQAPSHFEAIAGVLVEQLTRAESMGVVDEVVPTVVELAAAADSQAHQKQLNGAVMELAKSERAAVRLAAVRCEQALTDRMGEEWLSMLHEMLPRISELQEDDDEEVERETHRWIVKIEGVLGESLDAMLQ